MSDKQTCNVIGCERLATKEGRCAYHYNVELKALRSPFMRAFQDGGTTFEIARAHGLLEQDVHRAIISERGW